MGIFGRRKGSSNETTIAPSVEVRAVSSETLAQQARETEAAFDQRVKELLKDFYANDLRLNGNLTTNNPSRMLKFMLDHEGSRPSYISNFFEDDEYCHRYNNVKNDVRLESTPQIRPAYVDMDKRLQVVIPRLEREVQSELVAQALVWKISESEDGLTANDHREIEYGLSLYSGNVLPTPKDNDVSMATAMASIDIVLDNNSKTRSRYIEDLLGYTGMPTNPEFEYTASVALSLARIRRGAVVPPRVMNRISDLGDGFSAYAEQFKDPREASAKLEEIFGRAQLKNLVGSILREHTEAIQSKAYHRAGLVESLGQSTCMPVLRVDDIRSHTDSIIVAEKISAAAPSEEKAASQPVKATAEEASPKKSATNSSVPKARPQPTVPAAKPGFDRIKIVDSDGNQLGPISFMKSPVGRRAATNVAMTAVVAGGSIFSANTAAASPVKHSAVHNQASAFVAPEFSAAVPEQQEQMVQAQMPGTILDLASEDVRLNDGIIDASFVAQRVGQPVVIEHEDRGDNVIQRELENAENRVNVTVVSDKTPSAGEPGVRLVIDQTTPAIVPEVAGTIDMREKISVVPGAQTQLPTRQVPLMQAVAETTGKPVEVLYAQTSNDTMGMSAETARLRELAYEQSGAGGMTLNDLITQYKSKNAATYASGVVSTEFSAYTVMLKEGFMNTQQDPDARDRLATILAAVEYPQLLDPGNLDGKYMSVPDSARGNAITPEQKLALERYIEKRLPDILAKFGSTDTQYYTEERKAAFAIGLISANIANMTAPEIARLVAENKPAPAPSRGGGRTETPPPKEGGEIAQPTEALQKALIEFGMPKEFLGYYQEYAAHYKVDIRLLAAQTMQESSFNPNAEGPRLRSGDNAEGLGQFMTDTWSDMKKKLGFPDDASRKSPRYAIEAQAYYLSQMLKLTDGNVNEALVGYNAGPGVIGEAIRENWSEPRKYVRKINGFLDDIKKYEQQFKTPPAPKPAPKTPERPSASGVKIHSGNPEAQAQLDSIINNNKNTKGQLHEYVEAMLVEELDKAGHKNGRLPDSLLMEISSKGHKLHKEAALSYLDMAAAYERETGRKLRLNLNDGTAYRTFDEQVYIKKKQEAKGRGEYAADPGTSNHGLGTSVDLDTPGGFGDPQYKWMIENGPRFGWFHAAAHAPNGATPEPWHFNFMLKKYSNKLQ